MPETQTHLVPLGVNPSRDGFEFRVWAPRAREVTLEIHGSRVPLQRAGEYFHASKRANAGDRYAYVVDGSKPVPDPVSRLLPEGVHGRTAIIDPSSFDWSDAGWRGLPLSEYVIYELHVGTFIPEGTFEAAIGKLDFLKNTLGVTAIELMPVAAFSGDRNWGYDGVSAYAVHSGYGGPDGLKRFVNAAHGAGLAVIIDVVYNHLGNEGNYLNLFGPYFTDRHQTPWGNAIDFAEPGVREYFIENAMYWLREYHADGLRLDAVQTIFDDSPSHVLHDIAAACHQVGREQERVICVIAESDENDSKLIREFGIDAFWSDDFHHAVHAVLTGERAGYYQDFGDLRQIARALEQGYVFQGDYFTFWNRPRGTPATDVPLPANVICIQNHDQVGNRARGERLNHLLTSAVARKAAAALLLLAPHTPLLFMGQEYDEPAPFQFFTSFDDPALVEGVRKGRREEFKDFPWDEVPDPQDPATFERSELHWEFAVPENEMLNWYQSLIALRKECVMNATRTCKAEVIGTILTVAVPAERPRIRVDVSFRGNDLHDAPSGWTRRLYAADEDCAIAVYVA